MEINVTFRHSEPSDSVRQHILERIQKLSKYLIKPTMAHVTLNTEGTRHTAEISLSENHAVFNAHDTTHDLFSSVDSALDKIEVQLKKYKEKIKDHHKTGLKHIEPSLDS
ncbi:MAG: ribosome-associated translation inhibitor RaiA [Deltaproteobacteria bacterium]|nr:MAG: ribosome-associated translation inhibitor RaiA [Deltaproteobacteria bacterium]